MGLDFFCWEGEIVEKSCLFSFLNDVFFFLFFSFWEATS